MYDLTPDNLLKILGISKQEGQSESGPTLHGDAKGVLESIRPLVRPQDVQKLFKIDEVRTEKLSGRGGDVTGVKRGETVLLVFNENEFGTHHPILWAALMVRELRFTDQHIEDLPITPAVKRRASSDAISFLNGLDSRMSLTFLEKEIVKESKELIRRKKV